MIGNSPFSHTRLMVPRWRSYANTVRSRELGPANLSSTKSTLSPELLKRLGAWRLEPNLMSAAELVETAIVEGHEPEAIRAATMLLRPETTATSLVKKQAALLMCRAGRQDEVPVTERFPEHETLKLWRERTRTNPSNAVAWVELARCHIILGRKKRAQRSMNVAQQIAPHNRYVLRSAARLYLHLNQADKAHALIAKNPATKFDPWLLSAEIALSQLTDHSPTYYKTAISLLGEGKFLPRQVTELAGAVATTELIDGSRRKAGKFFRQSIVDPNGSALAQAEWATPVFGATLVPESSLQLAEDALEANTFHLYRLAKFQDVPSVCLQWSSDEPFSVRPYEFGAQAANIVGDFEAARMLAERGLRIRPDGPALLNSAAFSLANLGYLDQAEALLHQVKVNSTDDLFLVTEANKGLVAFRRGQIDIGRAHYRNAIEGFRYKQRIYMAASARAYLAREVVRAGLPDGETVFTQAKKEVEKHNFEDLKLIVQSTEKILIDLLSGGAILPVEPQLQ